MIKLGVIGHPISHSKSPEIHSQFAIDNGITVSYEKYDIPPEDFVSFVQDFFKKGGHGLNITVPYKEEAFKLSKPASDRVAMAKAVNTLYRNSDGELMGDNTDGPGVARDLTINQELDLASKRILILGAGGAVRGILSTLISLNPRGLVIANRSVDKATKLKEEFTNLFPIHAAGYEELGHEPFDLIINATSLGLSGEVPPISERVIHSESCCYDLMYSHDDTSFVTWGKKNGAAKSIDGLGMLVEQAAVSFKIWSGCEPETKEVIKALRS